MQGCPAAARERSEDSEGCPEGRRIEAVGEDGDGEEDADGEVRQHGRRHAEAGR